MALGRKQVVDRLRVEGFNSKLARNSLLDISVATCWTFCPAYLCDNHTVGLVFGYLKT